MTVEAAIDELTDRLDRLEADLGRRVTVLERAVQGARTAPRAVTTPTATTAPPPRQIDAPPPGGPVPVTPDAPVPPPPSPTTTPSPTPSSSRTTPAAVPPPPLPSPPPPVAADAIPGPAGIPGRSQAAGGVGGGVTGGAGRSLQLEDVLRIVGVGLVGLAALFLVSTAISRGWISPELQLLGATMIGLVLSGAAVHQADRRTPWAVTFGIGGSAVTAICAGAAHAWLDLTGPVTALVLVAAAVALSVLVAARVRSEAVAIAATAAMLLVPPFADLIADSPVLVIGSWLGLFAVAAAIVGVAQGWQTYRLISTWATAFWVIILAAVLADGDNTDHLAAGSCLVAVVGVVLWLGPVWNERLLQARTIAGFGIGDGERRTLAFEHRLVALVPLWAWQTVTFFGGLTVATTGAALALGLAAGFALVAAVARRVRLISELGTLSHLLGAGLLATVGLLVWLEGPILVVALAAQGIVTLLVAGRFEDVLLTIKGVALAGLAWVLVLVDLVDVIQLAIDGADGPSIGSHVARGVTVALLGTSAWLMTRRSTEEIGELVVGAAWSTAVLVPVSLVAPVVGDSGWLVVGTAACLVSLVAARRLGRLVLAIAATIGGVTAVVAAVGIVDAAVLGFDGTGVPIADHLSHLVVVLAFAAVTAVFWNRPPESLSSPLFVTTWLFGLGWLLSVLAGVPQAQAAISVTWAVAAVCAIVAGLLTGRTEVRSAGLVTLGVVLVKLLTIDLAEVDTLWRVGLFLIIGLGLMRLGYVLPELAARYAPPDPADESASSDARQAV
ncbi:MAG: DUF2339 domain-containing protein [Actinomycetota bacterium]